MPDISIMLQNISIMLQKLLKYCHFEETREFEYFKEVKLRDMQRRSILHLYIYKTGLSSRDAMHCASKQKTLAKKDPPRPPGTPPYM
jgi:hypothetical protein